MDSKREPKKKTKLFHLCKIVLFLAFMAQCALILQSFYETWKSNTLKEELQSLRSVGQYMGTNSKDSDWSKGLLDENPDYRGWLTVYGTSINNPVVASANNKDYLSTNFEGEWSSGGTLFLDKEVDDKNGGNVIIYGHKMHDDTMFGELDKFTDKKFFEENGIICWEDQYEKKYYDVFAVMVVPGSRYSARFIDFTQWLNDITTAETQSMLESIKSKASIFEDGWYSDDDDYLFLITCDYTLNNGRLVVIARSL